ncbi:VanZ family protein [Paenibacillus methanolicus]|uniref:VanZ family protein n=1 Tax=Paenibacillus methanolicus TaxID=582686 RepID=A0A5S5C0I7_9BACL|nr:VanZ family protein [Paenibacillus methanolicus]TYP72699.1 VanZ family protein [Paenibacillus methanolicus]
MQTANRQDKKVAARSRRLLRFVPALLWMGIIFSLSSRTGDEMNTFLPWFQALFPAMSSFDWGHFVAYFVLAITFDYGFGSRGDRLTVKALIVCLCLLYGITDEYHQSFVGGRSPDIQDLRNDTIGAALAVTFLAVPFVRRAWRKWAS